MVFLHVYVANGDTVFNGYLDEMYNQMELSTVRQVATTHLHLSFSPPMARDALHILSATVSRKKLLFHLHALS